MSLLSLIAPQVVQEAGAGFDPLFVGWIILLPFLGFLANGILALRHGRISAAAARAGEDWAIPTDARPASHTLPSWIGPGVLLGAFILTLLNFLRMQGIEGLEPTVLQYWTWIDSGTLGVDAAVQIDPLSIMMMMVVTGVGFLIHVFSVGYMKDDPAYPRYFAYLNLFVFFMLVLVMGASFPVMFVGWEGVGLCSYLLIGFWFGAREKADAGQKAFIVNRIGDVGFLIALFFLYTAFGTLSFQGIFPVAEDTLVYGGGLVTAITLFFLLGAAGKSAQIPLYVWLPDAMAGPTPVSALIHAATMVTAGVYLVARSSVLFAMAPVGSAAVATVGALTALFAATIALVQTDIKRVLAYSTVSQLGYMFLGVGVGAYTAGVFHLMTHAFFKALLFLGAGAVIHSMHHALHHTHSDWDAQDMRNMGGLKRWMPVTWITMWIATLAIAGIWPFAGFFSKDEILWKVGSLAASDGAPFPILYSALWVLALVAAVLTAFYMARLMVMTFHGQTRLGADESAHMHKAPAIMTIPLMVLAVLSVFGGWINVPADIQASAFGGFGALPMTEWLHHWLEPVTAAAHHVQEIQLGELAHSSPIGGGEVLWAAISTVGALIVVGLTVRSINARKILSAHEGSIPTGGIPLLLHRKWYVDELYDRVIVRPLIALSRGLWKWVDQGLIDGTVNAFRSFWWFGWAGSWFQGGTVNGYAFFFTVGVLVLLGVIVL